MKILIVNDDGIDSQLMRELARALTARGHRVTVCAPVAQQSGKSHSFTIHTPVMAYPKQLEGAEEAWAIDGTPVDCARLGIMEFCREPDLVISGINNGLNKGSAVWPSGTVGAAREAALQLIPAMALSIDTDAPEETVRFFCDWSASLAEYYVAHFKDTPRGSLLNVNMPAVEVASLKTPVICDLCESIYRSGYERRVTPRGIPYFWLGEEMTDPDAAEGSDAWYLQRGHITLTFVPGAMKRTAAENQDFLRDF